MRSLGLIGLGLALSTAAALIEVQAASPNRAEAALAAPVILENEVAVPQALWKGVRVFLSDQPLNPAQAFEQLQAGKGHALRHGDDDFGRRASPAWATFALQSRTGQTGKLVLSTRQTTLEVFELYMLKEQTWVRVLGRHELAKESFERDRTPSFELQLNDLTPTQFLLRTLTAAPIKYLLEIQPENAHRAVSFRQHFWVIVAYAVPLALMLFISLLRKMENTGGDPVFVGLVLADLIASSWLIGLATEIFPNVSGWTFRWFGQLSYAALFFFLCWHERTFLQLSKYAPLADRVLRVAGWIGPLLILALLMVDIRLGAQWTLPILLSGAVLCLGAGVLAHHRQAPYAFTYCTAISVYVASGLTYVLYYLGIAPMEWFGVLAFCQTAGICIIMSFAVARSLLAKDQKLQDALTYSDQQRSEIQMLAMERDRIFAAANHDLRQPLQAVALNLELMRQFDLNPEQEAISARMRLALASMSNMLSSFLDLRRSGSAEDELKLEAVALGPILDRLGLEYREHARAKGLSLKTVKTSLWVLSDALLLERAIRNLLSNALRYTDQGRVLIGVRRRGIKVSVVVIDSGRGISNEQLSQLFKEGRELRKAMSAGESSQAKDLRYESYGLGLFIVKAICQRLKASVLVQSKVGEGSSFQILLPQAAQVRSVETQTINHSEHNALQQSKFNDENPLTHTADSADRVNRADRAGALGDSSNHALLGLRVLIIDDDPAVLLALRKLLVAWGARVVEAGNAQIGQRQLASHTNFQAIICDFDLGEGKTGLELLRIAEFAQPDARRILMSGRPKSDILGQSNDDREPGNLLWLAKPLDMPLLLRTLVQTRTLGYSK
jgi:signal transduction histidine kinase/CheY-like chemotaxis protein